MIIILRIDELNNHIWVILLYIICYFDSILESGSGFNSKMDKALFADSISTSIGAIFGTSNTTTYVEGAAGIGAGGRTGLTSVITAVLFILSMFLAPIMGVVPTQATAPALIVVCIMMVSSFKDVAWDNLEEAYIKITSILI